MIEKEHVLNILKEAKKAVKEDNVVKLKELSNQTIHSASIYQDSENITLAVIIYSLSKIIERKNYKQYKIWPYFFKAFMAHIEHSIEFLEKNDIENFEKEIGLIRKEINKLSGNFKKSIKNVFQRASINKASRLYEHGVSMEKTAKLLGITEFELAEYSGRTGVSDVNLNITIPVKRRIKNAMEMFE